MILTRPKSRFIRVKCEKCNSSNIIFNKPAVDVKGIKCNELLAKSTGGNADVKGKVLEVLE
jgi:small subunit ribosomal protein S27e